MGPLARSRKSAGTVGELGNGRRGGEHGNRGKDASRSRAMNPTCPSVSSSSKTKSSGSCFPSWYMRLQTSSITVQSWMKTCATGKSAGGWARRNSYVPKYSLSIVKIRRSTSSGRSNRYVRCVRLQSGSTAFLSLIFSCPFLSSLAFGWAHEKGCRATLVLVWSCKECKER
jgi:hypothetical protein